MINRYVAKPLRRDLYSPTWSVTQTRSFKKRCSAQRWLDKKLSPVECTRYTYHRDRARADFGEIRDDKRQHLLEVIETELMIVPSVGELGITP